MRDEAGYWGPLAQGIYIALLALTAFVGWIYPHYLIHYLGLLVFLGLGLKPILRLTGLHALMSGLSQRMVDARWNKRTRRRRQEVARKERDKRYRHSRVRDPRLPPNW